MKLNQITSIIGILYDLNILMLINNLIIFTGKKVAQWRIHRSGSLLTPNRQWKKTLVQEC